MALDRADLNATDEAVLDYLGTEGRATPTLLRKVLDERGDSVSRQYVNQRLVRLAEHGHVRNVRNTGVYELVNDPRGNDVQ